MQLKIFQVDAFADSVFSGNPAAVVPLAQWLPNDVMQNIGMENNLSETAFFVPIEQGFHIRWFTPGAEVSLCGHATLATARIIFDYLGYKGDEISLQCKRGMLKVKKQDDFLFLDFPASRMEEIPFPENIEKAFESMPQKCFKGLDLEDMMLVFDSEKDIQELKPDFEFIKTFDQRGVITTAKSKDYDFVSRFFAPAVSINEDPVTGSAHTLLIPFWAQQLGKNVMTAKQISKRGGILQCLNNGDRVEIGGKAITYMKGEIKI